MILFYMVGIFFSIALPVVVAVAAVATIAAVAAVATIAAAAIDYPAFIILRCCYIPVYTTEECVDTSSMEQIVHYFVGGLSIAPPDLE